MIYVSKIGAVQECSIAMFVSLKLDDAGCLLLDLATDFFPKKTLQLGVHFPDIM